MNQDPNNLVQAVPETQPQVDLAPIAPTVAAAPPVVEQPALPPQPEAPTEEPVMIAANIDEVPDSPPVDIPSQPLMPSEPAMGPDLGQPGQPETETVPTFQQLAEVPVANAPVAETPEVATPEPVAAPAETAPVAPVEAETVAPVEPQALAQAVQPEAETQQAEVVPTFQQLAVPPTPATPETMVMQEAQPQPEAPAVPQENKKKKFIPILVAIIIIALIGGAISISLKHISTIGKADAIQSLRPARSDAGNMNIAVLGATDARKDVYVLLNHLFGKEITKESLDTCPSFKGSHITYTAHKETIKSEKNYNLLYLCDLETQKKYLIEAEGDNTIDGVFLVVNVEEGMTSETVDLIEALKAANITQLVVYIVGDQATIENDLKSVLEKNGFHFDTISKIEGPSVEEESVKGLMREADAAMIKIEEKEGPSVIQSFKKVSLLTYFKTTEEEGLDKSLKTDQVKTMGLKLTEDPLEGKVSFQGGKEEITPGEITTIKVELDDLMPLELGMRVEVYYNNKVVGIGVISALE